MCSLNTVSDGCNVHACMCTPLCRLEPGSKALASERRALVAQHAATEKLPALPRVTMPVQRSPPAAAAPAQHAKRMTESKPTLPAGSTAKPKRDAQSDAAARRLAEAQLPAARSEPAVPGPRAGRDSAAAEPHTQLQPLHIATSPAAGPAAAREPGQAGARAQHDPGARELGSGIFGSALSGRAPVKSSTAGDGAPPHQQLPGGVDREATAAALAEVGVQLGPPTSQELAGGLPPSASAAAAGPAAAATGNTSSGAAAHAVNGHAGDATDGTAAALAAAKRALAAKPAASARPPRSGGDLPVSSAAS